MIKRFTNITLCFSLLFIAVDSSAQSPAKKGLKDYYKDYFPIGVAVGPRSLTDSATRQLILTQFNSLTPENAMKMKPIHPQENTYNWKDADAIVDFAQAHHMRVRGHNLCWHQETPDWIIHDKDGNLVTKEVLLSRLKDHIYTVVNRYKGKIYAWDVVNEAIADGGDKDFRNTVWYQICGEDFIFKAFQYAHEADPKAILFYNEYGTESPVKRERVYQLLKRMIDAGVPVNAIGLQAHWSISNPTEDALITSIKKFSSLGLKVQITEMDISVYTNNDKDPKDANFTPEREQKQADLYAMAFKVFRDYKQYITGVTFWNVSDRNSWLDNFPIRGRKNYPLLFDQNLQPKKAYQGVVNF
ncbi:MAG TPA: endo-1,4-beta-xylanase [Mucilaginibacter sp.]|jgi:endo-1,4-beta-xylanase|nr:endo-1,4-beta-xylanase [Mucilaginibacter sp.]